MAPKKHEEFQGVYSEDFILWLKTVQIPEERNIYIQQPVVFNMKKGVKHQYPPWPENLQATQLILPTDFVYPPVNSRLNHLAVAVVNINTEVITYYDSNIREDTWECVSSNLKIRLEHALTKYGINVSFQTTRIYIPSSIENACSLVACSVIKQLVEREEDDIEIKSWPQTRLRKILAEINKAVKNANASLSE